MVKRFSYFLNGQFSMHKYYVESGCRMEDNHIKVKCKWVYLYRAVDKYGATIDFLLRAK